MNKFKGSLLILILLLLVTIGYSSEYKEPISAYKANYFLTDPDKDAKYQISIKGNLFYPSETGLYIGYTQIAFWDIYDKSSPFKEFNHSPEFFYLFENGNNIFGNAKILGLDYIQLSPFWHKSNGISGPDSRSINCYYGEAQFSYGDTYNVGIMAKGYGYYKEDKNDHEYSTYRGKFEGEVFLQLMSKSVKYFDKERLYVRSGMSHESKRGWVEGGLKVRIITTYFQPFLYCQVWHGYAESMINYKEKDTIIRLGLTFN